MHFFDDSLLPENQEKLVIQAAPYGPAWLPSDSDDIPVSMDAQVQKAVDCYNAGATVLHVHVREADGKGSKRISTFNELLARLRVAVPKMLLQVGGSISFAPEGEGQAAKWPGIDTRHMLAELTPQPDQVTIVINTNQMSLTELMSKDDVAGTSLEKPEYFNAYREMVTEAPPSFVAEHLKRLVAKGIQPHFMLGSIHQLETVERLIRAGVYAGPLVLNHMALGGGYAGRNPADMLEFVRRVPDGAVLTIESQCAPSLRSARWRLPSASTFVSASKTTCGGAKGSGSRQFSRSSRWCASRASWGETSRLERKPAAFTRSASTIETLTKR